MKLLVDGAVRGAAAGEPWRWRPARRAVVVAVLAVLVVACGRSSPTGERGTIPTGIELCGEMVDNAKALRFPADNGASLNGAVLGQGRGGVVLARDLCQWLPYGRELAKQGYQVLVFDFEGAGTSELAPGASQAALDVDVAGAVAALRSRGATKVVLMGASLGATAVLGAAAIITPPVDGVISLSAPDEFHGVDARKAVPKLTMPVLFVAAERDGGYAEGARSMHASAKQHGSKLLVVTGSGSHGVGLLDPRFEPNVKQVRAEIEAFIQANAR